MELSKRKRRRILLLFLLGVGLPSLLLGYLAFRGVQNDRALLEKQNLEEYRKIAKQITSSIEEDIFKVEQAFLNAYDPEISQPDLIRTLEIFKKQQPLVEEIFLFQNFEKIHFPAAKLLFLLPGSTGPFAAPSRPFSLTRKIQTGQQLEFQQRNFRKALVSYHQTYEQVFDLQTKGELLNAVARVQKKSSLFQDAIKSYETIARDFSQVRVASGVPLGLAARMELGSLFLANNDHLSSIKILIESYKALVHREWILEKAQYDFFSQNIKKSIEEILSQTSLPAEVNSFRATFQMLREEEFRRREITEKLLAFQEKGASDLQAKVSLYLDGPRNSSKRLTLEIGKHSYLVSLLSLVKKDESQTDEIWGLLINAEHLKDSLLQQAIKRHLSPEEAEWIIKGKNSEVLLTSENLPSGTMTASANFSGNFPDWSIEFYQHDPRLFETFLTSPRGIYFYMFLLIGGILIFGLILTIRTVAHELELAKMKSDFVSTISHEFKSPLTSIRQLAEMLQAGRIPSEDRRQKYYDVLVEQSERLTLLTENVLNFAQMEEGRKKFKFERIDIGALLEEVVSAIQDRVSHDGFELQLKIEKPLPSIMLDSAAITQTVNNLIDNAIKYSGKTKKAIVSSFTEDQNLIIAVQDFGVGIRKGDIDKVFDRFYRGGDELTRTVKGSGLGLTLVKQIVEAHHGTVHVQSDPGQGCTFSIKLPLK